MMLKYYVIMCLRGNNLSNLKVTNPNKLLELINGYCGVFLGQNKGIFEIFVS